MLLSQAFQYKNRKIFLRVDKLTTRGTIYIDGNIASVMNTTEINLLRNEAQCLVDKEVYGNIYNFRT